MHKKNTNRHSNTKNTNRTTSNIKKTHKITYEARRDTQKPENIDFSVIDYFR